MKTRTFSHLLILVILSVLLSSCISKKEAAVESAGKTNPLLGVIFNAVHCNSETDCWAVSDNGLIYRNTTAQLNDWQKVSSPFFSNERLYDVSCKSPTDCYISAGTQGSNVRGMARNTSGNSNDFSITNPTINGENGIMNVTCPTTGKCWFSEFSGGVFQNVDGDDGNWPITNHVVDKRGRNIYCQSDTNCFSHGSKKIVTRNTSGAINDWVTLNLPVREWLKVTCGSATDCWFFSSGAFIHNSTMLSTDFNQIANPPLTISDPGGNGGTVLAMFCRTPTDCYLSGLDKNPTKVPRFYRNTTGADNGFYEIDLGFQFRCIKDITCTSANHCIAVGCDGLILQNSSGSDDDWKIAPL